MKPYAFHGYIMEHTPHTGQLYSGSALSAPGRTVFDEGEAYLRDHKEELSDQAKVYPIPLGNSPRLLHLLELLNALDLHSSSLRLRTPDGCLLNVLKNFSNAAISRDGKTLLDPEEREVLYAILLEPMVYEDMRGYLVRKRRKADRSLLAKASRYYAYEMEKDWDQTYWDSLWTAIIDTQKTRQPAETFGTSYELLVIPQSNDTAIHVP